MPTQADPLETAVAESQDALSAMESEAAEYFAAQDSAKRAVALNPVAPALEKAATPSSPADQKKAAPAPTAPHAKDAATSKVPGAPTLRGTKPKADAQTSASTVTPPSVPSAPADAKPADADFSDVPREYKPGEMRGRNWDRLHAKADHFETLARQAEEEREKLRAELEAAKSSTVVPSDVKTRLDTLQAERDALRTQLESVAGERIFDAESKPRREAALAQAKAAVGLSDAAKIEQILALGESAQRDNAIEELLSSLTPLRATKLTQAVADLDRLAAERALAASRGGELYNQRVTAAQAAAERAQQERNARATATFDTELKEWEAVGLTADEVEAARSVYSGNGATLQDASRAALWAVTGPRVAAQLQEALARQSELEGELARLRGAQPSLGAGGSGALPTASENDADDPATTGYAERIAREAMKAGLRFGV